MGTETAMTGRPHPWAGGGGPEARSRLGDVPEMNTNGPGDRCMVQDCARGMTQRLEEPALESHTAILLSRVLVK